MNAQEFLQSYFEKADLTKANFSGADLSVTNLSGANLSGADLTKANFSGANLSVTDLRWADLSGANLRWADLTKANFSGANLSVTDLRWADLRWADFTKANFSGANLSGANLSGAKLQKAVLPENLPIPIIPNIHQAVYEATKAENSLEMASWHTCETTHCRAGWVVVLAGKAGKDLEEILGTNTAAALICQVSDPKLKFIPDWYASTEKALADIARLAGK